MIDSRQNMVIIDGDIRTSTVDSCWYTRGYRYLNIIFNTSGKIYTYASDKAQWLKRPVTVEPQHCQLFVRGVPLRSVAYIALFQHEKRHYWYIEYTSGQSVSYADSEIEYRTSCLKDDLASNRFAYLRQVASLNTLRSDDGQSLLQMQYDNIDFIAQCSVAAAYLNPRFNQTGYFNARSLIYPFGCNASQQRAIRAAFEHQVSIIQGPPGTGKTQTILNIVANLVCQGKTALIVSNNNSAIENVIEKLRKQRLDFLAALLGSNENKASFIASQSTEKQLPHDIESWHSQEADAPPYLSAIQREARALRQLFAQQEQLATLRQEFESLKVERAHFEQEVTPTVGITLRQRLTAKQLLSLWSDLQFVAEQSPSKGITAWLDKVRWYLLRRKVQRLFRGIRTLQYRNELFALIPTLQQHYYAVRCEELSREIAQLQETLQQLDIQQRVQQLTDRSMTYLHNRLYHRYGKGHKRTLFRSLTPLFTQEYPIVLSTAFSSRTHFGSEQLFDYVIIDEASQLPNELGLLALSCARNAVVVGDSMQLPHVVTEANKLRLQAIAASHRIEARYECANTNFLESMCSVFPDAPQTLLREHYRCHPKIINFCNQKFYGGQLVIMTQDRGEEHVIEAWTSVAGNHARGKMNPREVEVITREVLPTMPYDVSEIGIIAPYNEQVNALTNRLEGRIDVATVHKFQGREKRAIVLSVVDDVITPFTDDSNLLNVAVSRAQQRFCLVVSGNDHPQSRNIADLLAYIRYNNCSVTTSKIHSVFDLLYAHYEPLRRALLARHRTISAYDSENITYALLEKLLHQTPEFRQLGVLCHQPLRLLIRDFSLLNDEEQRYASNGATHVDFLVYNIVSKCPLLAIETDGYAFHKEGSAQAERDSRKDRILAYYHIPLLRLSTVGVDEEKRIREALSQLVQS